MRDQFCIMKKRRYQKQNLNNDYSITKSGSLEFMSNMSLELFVVWCRSESAYQYSLLVVIFGVCCGIVNTRCPPPLKTYARVSSNLKENS